MSERFPKAVRAATVKCVPCNAPGASTVEDKIVCVRCGNSLLSTRSSPENRE